MERKYKGAIAKGERHQRQVMKNKIEIGNHKRLITGFVEGGEISLARKRHLRVIMNVELNPPRPLKTSSLVISFFDHDFKGTDQNLHDPMVISLVVRNYTVQKVLVDQGS